MVKISPLQLRIPILYSVLSFNRYQSYVKACITGRAVADEVESELVDHRFFHETNDETGYCICDAVMEAAKK